jgi:hypothetical protein
MRLVLKTNQYDISHDTCMSNVWHVKCMAYQIKNVMSKKTDEREGG